MKDRSAGWLQITTCPECRVPAEVAARHVQYSTNGPVEHARVRCARKHVFNLPVEMLEPADRAVGDGCRGSHSSSTDAAVPVSRTTGGTDPPAVWRTRRGVPPPTPPRGQVPGSVGPIVI